MLANSLIPDNDIFVNVKNIPYILVASSVKSVHENLTFT